MQQQPASWSVTWPMSPRDAAFLRRWFGLLSLAGAIDLIAIEDTVIEELGVFLGGIGPFGVGVATDFDDLQMDDVDINDFAEQVAQRLGVRIPMPVGCATLGDLAVICAIAKENRL